MPDDSSAEQKAAQRAHADQARFFLAIERLTGTPRSQLRRAAREQARQARRQEKQPIDPPRPISETNPHLGPNPAPINLPPRPFTPSPSAVGKSSPPVEEGEWYEVELCDGTTMEVRARNVVEP